MQKLCSFVSEKTSFHLYLSVYRQNKMLWKSRISYMGDYFQDFTISESRLAVCRLSKLQCSSARKVSSCLRIAQSFLVLFEVAVRQYHIKKRWLRSAFSRTNSNFYLSQYIQSYNLRSLGKGLVETY